ncbi:hypothetical protein [Desulfosporosinus sp. FKB]|uniref:hypothetical protein n=1 Tax=Desulfosporosinus sp. FKB TaxID=1969835 RepID=UPI000B49FBDB|nr:hypothetical protein [Desulfosporosinus sp. FKB]
MSKIPGFRSGKTWKKVIATIVYLFIGLIVGLTVYGMIINSSYPTTTPVTESDQMDPIIVALIMLIISFSLLGFVIKGARKRKARGVLKSLFSMRFVKGIPDLREGQYVTIHLYKDKITLSDKQIIPLGRIKKAVVFTQAEVEYKEKDVIGRAALGELLDGSLGAVVGGMSGIGYKKIEKTLLFLSIVYTDKNGYDSQLVFLGKNSIFLNGFAKKLNEMVGAIPTKITGPYEI